AGVAITTPFRRMPYAEAMARYGSDKPDLRCGMEISELSAAFAGTSFGVFREVLDAKGAVRGFVIPGMGAASRKDLDTLVDEAIQLGAQGLVWARHAADGSGAVQSSILKAAGEDTIRAALERAGAGTGDLLVMAAGEPTTTSKLLGLLRLNIARRA